MELNKILVIECTATEEHFTIHLAHTISDRGGQKSMTEVTDLGKKQIVGWSLIYP